MPDCMKGMVSNDVHSIGDPVQICACAAVLSSSAPAALLFLLEECCQCPPYPHLDAGSSPVYTAMQNPKGKLLHDPIFYLERGGSPLSILMEVDVNGKQHALQWLTRCVWECSLPEFLIVFEVAHLAMAHQVLSVALMPELLIENVKQHTLQCFLRLLVRLGALIARVCKRRFGSDPEGQAHVQAAAANQYSRCVGTVLCVGSFWSRHIKYTNA
eukprot:scaffold97931_cov16-Tisochrysis_lutea.AAC.1